ncbi:hypothetical protein ACNSOS_06125 [Aliarcobacter vitoriensis]|uniref:Uncharacterized protein n=1 Tax=Aliarcobacter vitoriensis TaxID=2011099 RepID=A0A366MR81_9BACT|nr:hypothetical protein [Aliarcobacter vitoriensis]RBQ28557.1 hypothetical protein CRU91_08580 [Aliarcobacter vitoriensis]RBQ31783.1 hypothetical protein CRU92_06115 [Arcobacter sp. FW59]
MRFYSIFFIIILLFSSLFAKNIESVLKIKPPIKYHLNHKYKEIFIYKDPKLEKEESKYDFGIDLDINKELMTIDKLKIDVGTKFKGIN